MLIAKIFNYLSIISQLANNSVVSYRLRVVRECLCNQDRTNVNGSVDESSIAERGEGRQRIAEMMEIEPVIDAVIKRGLVESCTEEG